MELISISGLVSAVSNNLGLITFLLTIVFLYNYYTSTFNYFKERGLPFLKPTFLVGSIGSRVFLKISFHQFNIDTYRHFGDAQYAGYFEGRRPLILIRDPEVIKTVMIKDFDHFVDRNVLRSSAPPHISKMMINLKGKEWKNVRSTLTPTFSSGKLRGMEGILQQCGKQMADFLNNTLENGNEIEMKEFIGRYTLEVIGSCAFGLDCSSFKDPNAEFVKIASKFAVVPIYQRYIFFLVLLLYPSGLRFLPISMFNSVAVEHLKNVVINTKKERLSVPENRRNDFMQLMIDAAEKELNENTGEKVMTEEVIQAQAILFLFAGFETSSTLLSFACGELALHPGIQDQLRDEIKNVAQRNNGDCTYDSVNEIPLLENVLLETLRKYPPVSRVDRVCTKPYNLPGTNWTVNVGDVLVMPVAGVMSDPKYYPEPEKFDPERFSAEEKAARPPHVYFPFGMGPRNCIGLRFAMVSAKFAVFYLLKDFKLSRCSKTEDPVQFDNRAFLLKALNGVWVKIEPLETKKE